MITPENFFTVLVVGSVVKVIKEYGALLENVLMISISAEVLCTQLEVKQAASNKPRQRLNWGNYCDSESEAPLPFGVQRNNIVMVSETTHFNGCIVSIRR